MAPIFATLKKDNANPAAHRLVFKASNGYANDTTNNLYRSLGKANKATDKFLSDARARNLKWAKAEIIPLYEDTDSGLLLPHESNPPILRAFGLTTSV